VMVNTNRVEGWLATRKLGLVGLPGIGGYFSGWKMPALHWMRPSRGELYSWRREMALAFEQQYPEEFDIFGDGWAGQKISWCPFLHRKPNRCQRTESINLSAAERSSAKRKKLGNYKFVVDAENYDGSRGYISEKIFDAILGGSIPVYLGEKNITDFVPGCCFIDARNFSDLDSLVEVLINMDEGKWQRMRFTGKTFKNSMGFQSFTYLKFVQEMCGYLKNL